MEMKKKMEIDDDGEIWKLEKVNTKGCKLCGKKLKNCRCRR